MIWKFNQQSLWAIIKYNYEIRGTQKCAKSSLKANRVSVNRLNRHNTEDVWAYLHNPALNTKSGEMSASVQSRVTREIPSL